MDATTEHFPTAEDALAYRKAYDTRMKALYRMTMPTLRTILRERHNYVLGGPVSKEDHIREILNDEYPIALLNETAHVLHHRDWQNSACEWCAPVVPGLAEHTAAACDTITKAANVG